MHKIKVIDLISVATNFYGPPYRFVYAVGFGWRVAEEL